jgi:4-oxalmesaconate hydratase
MIIDVHGHYTTAPAQLDAYRGNQLTFLNRPTRGSLKISDGEIRESLQGQFNQMKEMGIDRIIFSPRASGMGHEIGNELVSRYWTETCNDLIARVCSLYPDKFIPVCALPQSPGISPRNCVAESERCVKEMGFVGCNINPDVAGGGQPFTPRLGDSWWNPLWEKMVELDVPGMIHASSTCDPARHLNGSHYIMIDVLAVYELCASDIFERYPTLKLIVPHGGGAVPYQWNRHRALQVSANHSFEETVRHLYFDTAIYDRDAFEMLIRKMGPDNVLFATEMFGTAKAIDPKTGRKFDDTVHFIDEIEWLTDEDRFKILEGNARKVFNRAKF